MSLLNEIETPEDGPVAITVTGDAGSGKTTFAATFPNPIVIRLEDGLQSIPLAQRPKAFPVVRSVDQLWAQLKTLISEEHEFETLIVDSVTSAESLFTDDVIASDPKKPKGINQALGGYGNGPAAVAAMHARLRKAAEVLRTKKGMNVIFIAHADTETIDPPDAEPYTRYALRLGKKSVAPWIDDVDAVCFIKLETFMSGDEGKKKARSDGTRVLVTSLSAANVSKNRFGIEDDLELKRGENPLLPYIPYLNKE